jgi:hypothetical protein
MVAAGSVQADSSERPPELWSWIKDLSKSKEACEIQSSFVLKKLKLQNHVENEYGIYGNVKSNRVVVKCIAITEIQANYWLLSLAKTETQLSLSETKSWN